MKELENKKVMIYSGLHREIRKSVITYTLWTPTNNLYRVSFILDTLINTPYDIANNIFALYKKMNPGASESVASYIIDDIADIRELLNEQINKNRGESA